MTDPDTQVREAFMEAVALDPSERPAFLEQRCQDAGVRERVRGLLDRHAISGEFLSRPAFEAFAGVSGSVGRTLGEYRILREVGRGGMGVVYMAWDPHLRRVDAVKVLSPELGESEEAVERLRREARAGAGLAHPNIVAVYRLGHDAGRTYIAMEYVEGQTLRAWRGEGTVVRAQPPAPRAGEPERFVSPPAGDAPHPSGRSMDQCGRLISEVADALDHAHRRGVVHRDVKPSNILVDTAGRARLTDFGIAKVETERTLAGATVIAGAFAYMSPEQARVRRVNVDHRSDIFSLGVVLYELLTGRRPFDGPSPQAILIALSDDEATPLRRLNRLVPIDLATICHKAIEKDPSHRYQTAAHMAADLRCWLEGRPILARPAGAARRVGRWFTRHQRLLVVAGVLGLACVAAGTWMLSREMRLRALGMLVVPESHRGQRVLVTRYDDRLIPGAIQDLGVAPLRVSLPPGLYRVRLVSTDGRALETSSLLDSAIDPTCWDTVEARPPAGDVATGMLRFESGEHELGLGVAQTEGAARQTPYWLERPRRRTLSGFAISRTEVSNAEYREFVLATGEPAPEFWPDPYDPALDALPVVDISWDQANRYCRWRGVRLPTPDEWEAAARAPLGAPSPWGESASPLRPRADLESDRDAYATFAVDVSSDQELGTALGLLHPLSNVQEYTEGIAADRNGGIVVKGRSWQNSVHRDAARVYVLSGRGLRGLDRGFRVAITLDLKRNDQ